MVKLFSSTLFFRNVKIETEFGSKDIGLENEKTFVFIATLFFGKLAQV